MSVPGTEARIHQGVAQRVRRAEMRLEKWPVGGGKEGDGEDYGGSRILVGYWRSGSYVL